MKSRSGIIQRQQFTLAEPSSNDFLPENQRFQGSAAEIEKATRQQQFLKKQMMLQQKREARVQDYHSQWRRVEDEHSRELNRLKMRAAGWKQGMKNSLGAAYNPITLDYDQTQQGRILKQQDDMKRNRSQIRMNYIDSRHNSGYNPINGQPRPFYTPVRQPYS